MKKLLKRIVTFALAVVTTIGIGTTQVSAAAVPTQEELLALYQALLAQQQAAAAAVPTIPNGTLIVGDSITALSLPYVAAAYPGAIIDARSGRPLSDTAGICADDGLGVLAGYAAAGTLPKKVIVALGSNNNSLLGLSAITPDMLAQVYNICGPNRQVYLVTEYDLAGSADIANNNAQIYLAARSYPNFHVLNWAGRAASHPSWIDALPYDPVTNPNGCDPNIPLYVHPTAQGSIYFAQTLAGAR